MRQIGKQDKRPEKPVVVAQFGQGNFLRGHADHMIDIACEHGVFEGSVAVIKPRDSNSGSLEAFERQSCAYTVILRGLKDGEKFVEHRVISAISRVINPFVDYDAYIELAAIDSLRFVISNTTEAGIVFDGADRLEHRPAGSFPGKLTQLLYARYQRFSGAREKGLIILPTELIEKNGTRLRECVEKLIALWELPGEFAAWVRETCIFCNCLVDRIVSGYPTREAETLERELLGYRDELLVVGEPYAFWGIESERCEEVRKAFPLDKAGLPVVFTDDLRPYRERKVRILNGGHTATVLAAYLAGLDTVGQAMANPDIRPLIEKAVYEEIVPTVPLPALEVRAFADAVIERFQNPFIQHRLLAISMNSVSKWRARILPTLKDSYAATDKLPPCLSFSLAALAVFYRSSERGEGCLIGRRGSETYEIRDEAYVLDFFAAHAGDSADELARALLANTEFWGEDLTALGDLAGLVGGYIRDIELVEGKSVLCAIRGITS